MAKKVYNYFDQFVQQMDLCKQAAAQLVDLLSDYTDVDKKVERIHDTEHQADINLHELMGELNRSFITPIDREDIVQIANAIDDIIDSIEDVSGLFDMLSITKIRSGAKEVGDLIMQSCDALYDVLKEFANFKSSKHLSGLIIKVNKIEEEGDRLYRDILKAMFLNETDAVELLKWKNVFDTLENILDDCEHVADLLDGLVIKNS